MIDFGYVSLDGSEPDLHELTRSDVIAFDTETSGTNIITDRPYGFSLTANPDVSFYSYMDNQMFLDLLADESKLKVAHNAKFDRAMLKKYGVVANNFCDTMVAAHLLEEKRLSLDVLLKRYLKDYDLDVKFFSNYDKPIIYSSLQEMANYFGPHSASTLQLWNVLERELRANQLLDVFWNIEMPALPVICDMELNGVKIDVDKLTKLGEYFDEKMNERLEVMYYFAKTRILNFNSADQAAHYIFEVLGVPKPSLRERKLWTEKGRPSVDKTYLMQYKNKYPFLGFYIEFKEYKHLKDTYVNGILKKLVNGRVHPGFNQTRTKTGRLSSTNPNGQNIPSRSIDGKKIRETFIAPEGCSIVKADMNQMELRKEACLAHCTPLIEAFKNNEDVHKATAIRAYNDPDRRGDGKTLNFKLIYGGGDEEEQALLFKIYPEVRAWMSSQADEFCDVGYAKTHYGRKSHLGDFSRMSRKEQAEAVREGLSVMNQGSCSEYLKLSMRKVWNRIKDSDIKMILQVHDELVFECPNKLLADFVPQLEQDMRYDELEVPLTAKVSIGNSWGATTESSDIDFSIYEVSEEDYETITEED